MTLDVNNREDCAKKFISNRWDYIFFKIKYQDKAYNLFLSWVGLGVFMGILAGGLVKDENDVTDLVKNLVTKEEGEPLPSL